MVSVLKQYLEDNDGIPPTNAHILVNYSRVCKLKSIEWIDAHEAIVDFILNDDDDRTHLLNTNTNTHIISSDSDGDTYNGFEEYKYDVYDPDYHNQLYQQIADIKNQDNDLIEFSHLSAVNKSKQHDDLSELSMEIYELKQNIEDDLNKERILYLFYGYCRMMCDVDDVIKIINNYYCDQIFNQILIGHFITFNDFFSLQNIHFSPTPTERQIRSANRWSIWTELLYNTQRTLKKQYICDKKIILSILAILVIQLVMVVAVIYLYFSFQNIYMNNYFLRIFFEIFFMFLCVLQWFFVILFLAVLIKLVKCLRVIIFMSGTLKWILSFLSLYDSNSVPLSFRYILLVLLCCELCMYLFVFLCTCCNITCTYSLLKFDVNNDMVQIWKMKPCKIKSYGNVLFDKDEYFCRLTEIFDITAISEINRISLTIKNYGRISGDVYIDGVYIGTVGDCKVLEILKAIKLSITEILKNVNQVIDWIEKKGYIGIVKK